MPFVIRWTPCGYPGGYVTKRQPNRKPYARTADDPDTKRWLTRNAAERFLALKDPLWASNCLIEEVLKCKIQWVTETGAPTPDDNDAVCIARFHLITNGNETTKDFPCCAHHAAQMPPSPSFINAERVSWWERLPLPEPTP